MPSLTSSGLFQRNRRWSSFTLIELLTVIAIITILAAITLGAAIAVQGMGARSRANGEIHGFSAGLEAYKEDNGLYPAAATTFTTNNYTSEDGSKSGGLYQTSSQALYQALAGKTNYADTLSPGTKSYVSFSARQLGNVKAAAGTTGSGATYVQDPWGYSYGYATGDNTNNLPYNGKNFYDFWSTGGWTTTTALGGNVSPTKTWIKNWPDTQQ